MAWWEGEDLDADTAELDDDGKPIPGTGLSHITEAIVSLAVLRDAMIQGMLEDDRPPSSPDFYAKLNRMAAKIIKRHADKDPRHYTIADSAEFTTLSPAETDK